MYAIVKTGGKQYKVEPGTVISIEKIDAEVGEKIELPVIFVANGSDIEADPEKAAATKVVAKILEQYKGKKQLVFKFKKRKGYKKLKGHRQQLTRVIILAVGDEKIEEREIAAKAEEIEEVVETVEVEEVEETAAVEEVVEETVEVEEEAAEEAEEAAEEAAEAEEAEEEAASEDAE